uniref:Transcriptional regulator n=1 Tax=uncultured bacterium scaffold00090 TaxID=1132476 RepID=I6ZXH4_9BACT|nr:transcriptional regulator [uncultured bacterium scaffold00090]
MDTIEKINFLSDALLSSTNITTFHFRPDFSLIRSNSAWENHLCNFFRFNCAGVIQFSKLTTDTMPVLLIDSLYLYWMIQPYKLDGEEVFLVLGPVFETAISQVSFKRQMNDLKMSVSSQSSFTKMTKTIPILPTQQLFHYGAMFHYAIFNRTISYGNISVIGTGQPADLNTDLPDLDKFDIPLSHGSQLYEKLLLKNVREGNINYTHNSTDITSIQNHSIGILCPGDPLRQAKDSIIVYTTLVTRAAVDGGLSVESAYSLSDYYIQNIELADSVNSVYELGLDMYDTFVRFVHQIRYLFRYSRTIQYVIEIIRKHIWEEIDITGLANEVGYNAYYMTKLFKKETGMSMKEFIVNEKIEIAKTLLETTSLDINKISDSLAFHLPSYFSTVFKKVTGYTPMEYRRISQRPKTL